MLNPFSDTPANVRDQSIMEELRSLNMRAEYESEFEQRMLIESGRMGIPQVIYTLPDDSHNSEPQDSSPCAHGKVSRIIGRNLDTLPYILQTLNTRRARKRWKQLMRSDKINNRVFDISFHDYLVITIHPCAYCGSVIDSRSIDRKDNRLGHTLENCVSCCALCNVTRWDNFTYEEMCEFIGPAVRKARESRSTAIPLG